MKKVLKIIGILLYCAIMICGIYLSCQSKTVDFSGRIVQIREEDRYTVLSVDNAFSVSYIVVADHRTKVRHLHKEEGEITLEKLKIGDKIQGNYKKWSSKDYYAKLIEVI